MIGLSGFGLLVVETRIEFVALIKFPMGALCDNVSVLKDEDAVCVLNSAEAVRNDQYGAAFSEGLERGLDVVLTLGVEC